jgi:hypothetical protein
VPAVQPPDRLRGVPKTSLLHAKTELWRVHDAKYPGDSFRPVAQDPKKNTDPNFGGGRFDSTVNALFPYFYAALRPTTALVERFLKDLVLRPDGSRILPREKINGKTLSRVTLSADINLLSLVSATDLAAVHQDYWLVDSDGESNYAQTRRWGHWFRDQIPSVDGFVWQSKRDRPHPALILFGDRDPPVGLVLDHASSVDLWTKDGASLINALLRPYRVRVYPPRR